MIWKWMKLEGARAAVAGGALLAASLSGGCAGLGMSQGELEVLEAGTADARFMDRTWAERSEAERREFARENALRWTYFNDLAHGRRPAAGQ